MQLPQEKKSAWGSSEDVSFYLKIHVTSCGLFEWAAVRLSSPRRTRKSTHSELTMWLAVLLTHLVGTSSHWYSCRIWVFLVLSLQSENCDPKWTFLPRTHSCYLKANRALEWREAQEYCESFGEDSNLVSVLNRNELEGVQSESFTYPCFLNVEIITDNRWSLFVQSWLMISSHGLVYRLMTHPRGRTGTTSGSPIFWQVTRIIAPDSERACHRRTLERGTLRRLGH